MFGLLMQDNTPIDAPFRRSGRGAEETVRLGFTPGGPYFPARRAMGFVPGGPYFPQKRFRGYGIPPGVAARIPQFHGYGIPPGQAARVPQYNGYGIPPGVAARVRTGATLAPLCPRGYVYRNGQCQPNWDRLVAAGTPLGFVPGGPYYPRGRGGFSGFVDESGYEHPDVVPGTGTTKEAESTSWTNLGTGVLNLGTSIVNAIAGSINPQSGAAGAYCPSGYYLSNGRCVPAQSSGGFSVSPTLVMGAVGIAALFFLTRKKS